MIAAVCRVGAMQHAFTNPGTACGYLIKHFLAVSRNLRAFPCFVVLLVFVEGTLSLPLLGIPAAALDVLI